MQASKEWKHRRVCRLISTTYSSQVIDMDKGPTDFQAYKNTGRIKQLPMSHRSAPYTTEMQMASGTNSLYTFCQNLYDTIAQQIDKEAASFTDHIEGLSFMFRRNPNTYVVMRSINKTGEVSDVNTSMGLLLKAAYEKAA